MREKQLRSPVIRGYVFQASFPPSHVGRGLGRLSRRGWAVGHDRARRPLPDAADDGPDTT